MSTTTTATPSTISRYALKKEAKSVLKKTYVPSFFVSLMPIVVYLVYDLISRIFSMPGQWNSHLIGACVVFDMLLWFAMFLLVYNPVKVSEAKYYLDANMNEKGDPKRLKFAFGDCYSHVVRVMAMKDLIVALSLCLLIFPGIYQFFRLFFVRYIVAENVNVTASEAREMSGAITLGHKRQIFGMMLSFAGWYLVGLMAMYVGVVFVQPYYQTTMEGYYQALKEEAGM